MTGRLYGIGQRTLPCSAFVVPTPGAVVLLLVLTGHEVVAALLVLVATLCGLALIVTELRRVKREGRSMHNLPHPGPAQWYRDVFGHKETL